MSESGRTPLVSDRQDVGVLVVMSGLPGSGKSTLADMLARQLDAAVLSVDPIEAAIWRAGIAPSPQTGVAAYEVAGALAAHQLALGHTVIGDAVNSLEVGRHVWRRAAASTGSALRVLLMVCSNVDVHRSRLAMRRRSIDGFPEPTWDVVELRRTEFEPWPEPTCVLDSLDDPQLNLVTAMEFLAAAPTVAHNGTP
jgi:predicted kinase